MAIKLEDFKRNRCIGWITKERAQAAIAAGVPKDSAESGKGLYSGDLTDPKTGNILPDLCAAWGIAPETVRPITVGDLPAEYAQSPEAALRKLASEWQMTPNDTMHSLVLNARLQDAANESVKEHRPVSDKAKDRAYSTTLKVLRDQHPDLSEDQVKERYAAVLTALATG